LTTNNVSFKNKQIIYESKP